MWELYIVVDGQEYKAMMTEPYSSSDEVEESLQILRKTDNLHLQLENEDFLCISKNCCNFHFIAKKVV